MKNKIVPMLATIVLIISVLPIHAAAAGGYYVIKGEKKYHSVFCEETMGYNIEDLKFYATKQEAVKAGLKSCPKCYSSGIDYEEDGATYWHSKDTKTQNALELERFMAVMDSMEVLEEECDAAYQEGYDDGISRGEMNAKSEFQKELDENTRDTRLSTLALCVFVVYPILTIVLESLPKKKSKAEKMRDAALAIKFEKDTVEPKQADNFSIHNSPNDHQKNNKQTQVNHEHIKDKYPYY